MSFPVICFYGDLLRIRETYDELTRTTTAGLKNGYFRNLLIVDSEGQSIKMADAHKLHGVGPFFGYNMFLNQRIRVALDMSGRPFTSSLTEVKKMVLNSFRCWNGWSSRDDFDELKGSVENARSIPEIIQRLRDPK